MTLPDDTAALAPNTAALPPNTAASQAEEERSALGRRGFLQRIMGGAVATATIASGCGELTLDKLLQQHYRELTEADKKRVFARIKADAKARFRKDINLVDPAPIPGVHFAFAISLSVCNGNRACVHACVAENNQSRDPAMQYIKVIEMERGSLNLEKGDMYFEGEVPRDGKYYLPTQCNQCDNPPCVSVCPVGATWKEQDGIVVVDYDWCIGCRYCMAACPYEARRFNFSTPSLERHEVNPNQGYLSNRVRPRGVVEKCHFCLHRTRQGAYPACAEACPTGARKFGDLNDPTSDVAQIIAKKRVFVLKEELQTIPKVFYYFD